MSEIDIDTTEPTELPEGFGELRKLSESDQLRMELQNALLAIGEGTLERRRLYVLCQEQRQIIENLESRLAEHEGKT